jgi:hypothetical protein
MDNKIWLIGGAALVGLLIWNTTKKKKVAHIPFVPGDPLQEAIQTQDGGWYDPIEDISLDTPNYSAFDGLADSHLVVADPPRTPVRPIPTITPAGYTRGFTF